MKKFLFIIPLLLLFTSFFLIPSNAATGLTYFVTCVQRENYNDIYQYTIFNSYPVPTLYTRSDLNNMPVVDGYFLTSYTTEVSLENCMNKLYEQLAYYSENGVPTGRLVTSQSVVGGWNRYAVISPFYAVGVYTNNSSYEPTEPSDPEPDPPEPGDSWLSDMWDWFLWQLGLNDDYSGDIDEYITGGDRERIELVTPTPSPTPSSTPSPTPYVLNIVDPNTGNPVYTITGIPNQNITINGGDTINNGSDFDIFAVDLQIGDGGTSNPRDGMNDVMDTSFDYVSELDTSAVSGSFSVLPTDWYVMIGVLICFPFIAGFISKLLK